MSHHSIDLMVNGKRYSLEVESDRSLLDVVREDLNLTGIKKGCDKGDCGACTVLLDGKPVNSCLVLAVQADGKEITTIEGVARDGKLDPIQEAFIKHGAVQCGFCTPGMILAARALLQENPQPTREEIQKAISGNLCRCTGYIQIIDAIQSAARVSRVNNELR
ncbi:MAG: (2Fe-2S)-binding protein [Desulfobacteraceae bacterium]|nr:(2Fe-2S)-binding protein [Desulfobacteraceae bacterium]